MPLFNKGKGVNKIIHDQSPWQNVATSDRTHHISPVEHASDWANGTQQNIVLTLFQMVTGQLIPIFGQLVPIFGQLVPVFWSTRTSQVNLYLLKQEIVDGQRSR